MHAGHGGTFGGMIPGVSSRNRLGALPTWNPARFRVTPGSGPVTASASGRLPRRSKPPLRAATCDHPLLNPIPASLQREQGEGSPEKIGVEGVQGLECRGKDFLGRESGRGTIPSHLPHRIDDGGFAAVGDPHDHGEEGVLVPALLT